MFAIGCGGSNVSTNGASEPSTKVDTQVDTTKDDSTSDVETAPTAAPPAPNQPSMVPDAPSKSPPEVASGTKSEPAKHASTTGEGDRTRTAPAKPKRVAKAKRTAKGDAPSPTEREKMSAFLLAPAKAAFKRQRWPRAVALYQGLVAARGPGSPEALLLAKAWTAAGQYDGAVEVYKRFLEAGIAKEESLAFAGSERKRLMSQPNPYKQAFEPSGARKEAFIAFKRGRKLFRKKRYHRALIYYQIGYALDADLPGFLRELGATYDKLGQRDKKIQFYRAYLRRRPFGKNARVVRATLRKIKGSMGRLNIVSPIKCDEVWVNRQRVVQRMPVKNLLVAPGHYKALCLSRRYQIAYFERASVAAGKLSTLKFNWAVVVNKLRDPHGRIRVEDSATGRLVDLGIAQPEYGVIVPPSGRALRVVLTSLDGAKKVERLIKIPPGTREIIKW